MVRLPDDEMESCSRTPVSSSWRVFQQPVRAALPNLRGSYVAHYINSALEKEGSKIRASILSQRPTVPAGLAINSLRPEVFLLIFEK
jgi:hypothetical protein